MSQDESLRRSLGRWLLAGIVVFLLLMATFPLYRAAEGADRSTEASTYRGEQVWAGRKIFADNCAMCHGDKGQGVDAPALNSKQFLRAANEEQIVGIVSVGIPGTNMQSWSNEYGGPLTPEEIRAVAAFLASLAQIAPDRPNWRDFTPSPTPPPEPVGDTAPGASPAPGPNAIPSHDMGSMSPDMQM